jgi:hypothetical protein
MPRTGMELPDWVEAMTTTSEPCGHRFSGDLTGFSALASEGRCVTCIDRADAANVVHRQLLRDARHAAGGRATHIQIR